MMKSVIRRLATVHPIWIVFILAIPTRLLFLNRTFLTEDEMDIFMACSKDMRTLFDWCSQGNWPPLYHLLVKAAFALHRSDLTERLPSALAAVLSLPVTYLVLRRFFPRRVSSLAVTFLLMSPFQLYHDRAGKMYSLLALMSMSSLYLLLKASEKGRAWRWCLYSVSQAANLYSSYFATTLFASHSLLAFLLVATGETSSRAHVWSWRGSLTEVVGTVNGLRRRPWGFRQRQIGHLILASFLVVILYSPWLKVSLGTLQRNVGEEGLVAHSAYAKSGGSMAYFAAYVFSVFGSGGGIEINDKSSAESYWVAAFCFLLCSGIGLVKMYRESFSISAFILFYGSFPFAWLLIFNPSTSYYPRYLMSFMPFFFALASQGLFDIAGALSRRVRWPEWRTVGLFVAVIAFVWSPLLPAAVFREATAWRHAVAYLDRRIKNGDVLIGGLYEGALILEHYMPQWRGKVAFVPMWEYRNWCKLDSETQETGLPRFVVQRHSRATVWFVTAYEKDVPDEVWRGIRGGFSPEATLQGVIESGTVLIYRRDL